MSAGFEKLPLVVTQKLRQNVSLNAILVAPRLREALEGVPFIPGLRAAAARDTLRFDSVYTRISLRDSALRDSLARERR